MQVTQADIFEKLRQVNFSWLRCFKKDSEKAMTVARNYIKIFDSIITRKINSKIHGHNFFFFFFVMMSFIPYFHFYISNTTESLEFEEHLNVQETARCFKHIKCFSLVFSH